MFERATRVAQTRKAGQKITANKQFPPAPLKNLTTHELFESCVSYVR